MKLEIKKVVRDIDLMNGNMEKQTENVKNTTKDNTTRESFLSIKCENEKCLTRCLETVNKIYIDNNVSHKHRNVLLKE